MSLNRIKLFNIFILLMLMISACGTTNPLDIVSDVEIPAVSDFQDQSVIVDEPPVPDQPIFGDEIYNALEACPDVALNEICLGSGSSSGLDLGVPGGRVLLTGGELVSVAATSLDDYSVVIARLQAPGVDADYNSLLILAAGTVEVSFDEIFYGRDETNLNLPRLTFSSTNGSDFQSGIVIINESDEDLLSIEVNGVGLTLGSTAVVTSQPNGEMKVTMQTGTVAVSANEETISAVKGGSVKVSMTQESKPAGTPVSGGMDEDLLTPLVPPSKTKSVIGDDLLTPLWPGAVMSSFRKAYDRCIAGDARQVYRAMYFARILLDNPDLQRAQEVRKVYDETDLQQVRDKLTRCATFELILTGEQQGAAPITWTTKVSGDVLQLQFDYQGKLVAPVEGELAVTEFSPSMPMPPGCSSTTKTENSIMRVQEFSTLKIYYNTMQIRMYFWPNPVTETLVLNCPSAPPVEISLAWNIIYWYLHPDLLRKENQSYLIQDWEYTGGQIFAEAFHLDRSGALEDGEAVSNTAFTLMHTPQR